MSEQNSVTQSNYLIRGRRGEGITLREQKLLYLAISMIEPNAKELSEFRIKVRDLYDLLGLGKNTPAKDLKETADKLVSRRFELPAQGETDFDFINIVSRCSYIEQEGEVVIRINKDIEPFLIQLRGNFTSYKLYNILKLKSEYAIALFQFFKSYAYQGHVEITLLALKDFLFFDTTKYPQYAYFKRDILKKSIQEINSKTDLKIDYEEIKQGRSVHSIRFIIKEEQNKIIDAPAPDTKIRGEKRVQLDSVLELFQRYGMELSAIDGYNYLAKAKVIWGDDSTIELKTLIENVLNDASILEPIKFIHFRLKSFETNVNEGLDWDYGFKQQSVRSRQREVIPEYWGSQVESSENESIPNEAEYFEAERQKILAKIGALVPDKEVK